MIDPSPIATPAVPGPRTRHEPHRPILALLLLGSFVAGCAGAGDQIVVRRDVDPYNLVAAQHEADQACGARGRSARFVQWQNNPGGTGTRAGLPDAIYDCVQSPAPRNLAAGGATGMTLRP